MSSKLEIENASKSAGAVDGSPANESMEVESYEESELFEPLKKSNKTSTLKKAMQGFTRRPPPIRKRFKSMIRASIVSHRLNGKNGEIRVVHDDDFTNDMVTSVAQRVHNASQQSFGANSTAMTFSGALVEAAIHTDSEEG